MNIDNPNTTAREQQIAMLENTCAKHASLIAIHQLQLQAMQRKQVHRMAELRMQHLLLLRAQKLHPAVSPR